ncbi:hypothetical protein [Methylotetracoccus oryzae]|uniref:hypothetical protein n=1 Tax=Methylotetracoccus oryzae TaxID=1919059 RepID=UPI001118D526|nr:hypothetical protein [Methylotetracoccus oryzae]
MAVTYLLLSALALFLPVATVHAISLETVDFASDIGGHKITFPVTLDLSVATTQSGVELQVAADINMKELQSQFDTLVKSFPMPNDNCPGYGQHVLPTVESASLDSVGSQALLTAKVNVVVWDCQEGLPLAGTTVRMKTKCLLGICTDVPDTMEVRRGSDIKNVLLKEGLVGNVSLSLVTRDHKSIELSPGSINVIPRGDLGRFANQIAGIFNSNLSSVAEKAVGTAVDAGELRQSLPAEIQAYDPEITDVNFFAAPDGALAARVNFKAMLTAAQASELIKKSIQK